MLGNHREIEETAALLQFNNQERLTAHDEAHASLTNAVQNKRDVPVRAAPQRERSAE